MSLPFCPPGKEAQELHPKNVLPVGPSLRAVDEKRGLEPDMCIPIFPNEAHPTGRAPFRPTSLFPYDNCYHWASMKLKLRIHMREDGFDTTRAIRLSGGDMVDMMSLFSSDRGRGKRALLAREQAVSVPSGCTSAPEPSSSLPDTTEQSKDASASRETDIFDPPTKDFDDPEFVPLVHPWLDLPANLEQKDIGDPVDLYRERFTITSIIRRAHERNPDLPTLREHIVQQQDPYIGDSDSDSDSYLGRMSNEYESEADASEPEDGYVSKPKRLRPAKILRKLRSSVREVFCIPF